LRDQSRQPQNPEVEIGQQGDFRGLAGNRATTQHLAEAAGRLFVPHHRDGRAENAADWLDFDAQGLFGCNLVIDGRHCGLGGPHLGHGFLA
jgi:hypothetical protein